MTELQETKFGEDCRNDRMNKRGWDEVGGGGVGEGGGSGEKQLQHQEREDQYELQGCLCEHLEEGEKGR